MNPILVLEREKHRPRLIRIGKNVALWCYGSDIWFGIALHTESPQGAPTVQITVEHSFFTSAKLGDAHIV